MSKVANYGAGVNSTAMLILLTSMGVKLDLILFADTMGEKPETYDFIKIFERWLDRNGQPEITRVVASSPMAVRDGSLEGECLRKGVLPSRAYGFGSCSQRWKIYPMDKYLHHNGYEDIIRYIGMDAGEPRRVAKFENTEHCKFEFPLGLGRSWSWAELVAAPESQLKVFQDVQGDVPCMCFDGETETDDL